MWEFILERANYWAIIGLMMTGLFVVFASENLIKRMVGLSVFQTSICLFYVTLGKVTGGTAPVLYGPDAKKHYADAAPEADAVLLAGSAPGPADLHYVYSNPLPHVLMLTAIVVGVATLSVGLAIVVRIREAYGTIEDNEVRDMDQTVAELEAKAAARHSAPEAPA
jgi:multicomponent Na+:H+ antiporter subunit C